MMNRRWAIYLTIILMLIMSVNIMATDYWSPCDGLPTGTVKTIEWDNTNKLLFAGIEGLGIYRSSDLGQTWALVSNKSMSTLIEDIKITANGYVFAGFNGAGVYKSTDKGMTWNPAKEGLTNENVTCLYTDDNTVYTGTWFYGHVFKSTDFGASWENLGVDADIYSIYVKGNEIFAGTQQQGLLKTTDNGKNWTTVSFYNKNVFSLVSTGDNIFAATNDGIYKSTDGGVQWKAVNSGLTSKNIRAVSADNQSVLFTAPVNAGMFRSTNGGDIWKPCNTGIDKNITALDFAAGENGVMFVASASGVYKSAGNIADVYLDIVIDPDELLEVRKGDELTYEIVVIDDAGQPVPEANINIKNSLFGNSEDVKPDKDGYYTYTFKIPDDCTGGEFKIDFKVSVAGISKDFVDVRNFNVSAKLYLEIAVSPEQKVTKMQDENYSFQVEVKDEYGELVAGTEVVIMDEVINDIKTLLSDEFGQVTYSAKVPMDKGTGEYRVTFFARKDGYINSLQYAAIVSVIPTTGVDYVESKVALWPNPAQEFINISLDENDNYSNLSIFDIRGNEIYKTSNFDENQIRVEIKNFNSGEYFLIISTKNRQIQKKFIKF